MKKAEVTTRIESLFEANPDIDFIKFFGGEPTLRIDLIKGICDFVENKLKKRVHFALTTNGTLAASRHLDLWQRYHVSVSVTVDGPPHVHDAVRTRADGRGSHASAVAYCRDLAAANFPFAVVGVFDERHLRSGMSYLDMIKYLNEIAPLSKVQFLESLGDAASHEMGEEPLQMARAQVVEAVDAIMEAMTSAFISPNDGRWLYDNNIFRFIYGIVRETALPYEHACTASNLTTIFPSGELMACYTFAEKSTSAYGSKWTSKTELEDRRQEFRAAHKWEAMAARGTRVPWYRGVVGDICVADMLNSSGGLEQSAFYKAFQETATLRILQWMPVVAKDPVAVARVLHAMEQHKIITGEYTLKMSRDFTAAQGA